MHTEKKFELLARSGYAARGVVYFLIGALALFSVFGDGGRSVGSSGALSSLLSQPFGRLLLGMIGVGFIGHVLWRLAQSVLNADRHDDDFKGYAVRAGLFASAATHAFLALTALQLAILGGVGGSEGGERDVSAWLMQQPFGRYLVGAVGLGILGAGVAQIYKGLSGGFCKWLKIPARAMPLLYAVCAAGLVARGAIFLIIAVFFLYAAFTIDPAQAGGLADALAWVRGLPFGAWLYGLAAVGLFAFAAYSLTEALYRHMNTAPVSGPARRAAGAIG
jgi:hypothetical protein